MGEDSAIAWTDHTFSPWWGCTEVSPGCDHCYARTFSTRLGNDIWGKESPRRFLGDKHWNNPLRWNRKAQASGKRTLVFCASMADVFESGRDDLEPWRLKLWGLIKSTPHLTWLLLTKRPQNIGRMLPDELKGAPNIWLGATVESPEYLWRAERLREYPWAKVRFLSMEPLIDRVSRDQLMPFLLQEQEAGRAPINWIVTGSESGATPRYAPVSWFREILETCAAFDVPGLFKQYDEGGEGITLGEGSFKKRDLRTGIDGMKRAHWIIEKPYLDGVQWMQFPEAA